MSRNAEPGDELAPRGVIAALFDEHGAPTAAQDDHPGWRNVVRAEADFREAGDDYDVLNFRSPFYRTRRASKLIYSDLFRSAWNRAPQNARVLEAGCGVGRFTLELAARFTDIVAVDGSPSALARCRSHLDKGPYRDRVRLVCADPADVSVIEENSFDLVVAVEYIGYADDPARALAALVRAAKPGATVCVTAEAPFGSLPADPLLHEADLKSRLDGSRRMDAPDAYVHYFTENEFRDLLREASLRNVVVRSSHYLIEGPFWNLVDESRLDEESYIEELLALEAACRNHPVVSPLARVVSGFGVK